MVDTATKMVAEMVDMEDDLEKMSHGRETTKAMGMTMILANSEDIRCSRTACGLSCGGFLESFFPSSPGVSHSSMHPAR
jgi:hypothetical protein